jgi:hypothetical protein
MSRLAKCKWEIAYDSSILPVGTYDKNRRIRIKELRFFNKAKSLYDIKLYEGMTLPPKMPENVAIFKLLDLDFKEEIQRKLNSNPMFDAYTYKYDD